MQNNQNGTINWLQGFLVGGLVALLFAPKKGEELRQDIKQRLDEAGVTVGSLPQEIRSKAEQARDAVVDKAEQARDVVLDKAEELKENVRNTAEQAKQNVQEEAKNARK